MDIINLKQIKQFTLECHNRNIIMYLIEIGQKQELFFKPDKPNVEFDGKMNEHCNIFFEILNKTYMFSGKLFCPSMEKFIVVDSSPIIADRRSEKRLPVPSLSVSLKEKGNFSSQLGAHAVDINFKGVRIQCLESLTVGVSYEMEISMVYKHQIHVFKSNFLIKNIIRHGFDYYCGGLFLNTTDENKQILDEYILDIQGKLRKDFLNP